MTTSKLPSVQSGCARRILGGASAWPCWGWGVGLDDVGEGVKQREGVAPFLVDLTGGASFAGERVDVETLAPCADLCWAPGRSGDRVGTPGFGGVLSWVLGDGAGALILGVDRAWRVVEGEGVDGKAAAADLYAEWNLEGLGGVARLLDL